MEKDDYWTIFEVLRIYKVISLLFIMFAYTFLHIYTDKETDTSNSSVYVTG